MTTQPATIYVQRSNEPSTLRVGHTHSWLSKQSGLVLWITERALMGLVVALLLFCDGLDFLLGRRDLRDLD